VLAWIHGPVVLAPDDVVEVLAEQSSDFVLLVDVGGAALHPGGVSVTHHNFFNVVHRKWDNMIYNFAIDQIELLTMPEFEAIIAKLTNLDNIPATISELQNETANALASLSLVDCKTQPVQLIQLRQKLAHFFGRLSLAHSIVTDLPLYSPVRQPQGAVVEVAQPPPNGLSLPLHRMLAYLLGRNLTQVHVCISHINKMLGEFTHTPTTSFTLVTPGSASLHGSPLCAPDAASICGEESPRMRADYGRTEPDVTLEVRTPYSISFREGSGLDTNPFSQFGRRGP
jgi:hypothetical protein